jgi:flavin reductase (DIM6/NTAB) family NADH-FMN oxidoreductase RutF
MLRRDQLGGFGLMLQALLKHRRTVKVDAEVMTETAKSDSEFVTIAPKILYFGTPVALVSTLNDDGSANLAPISSFWTLGWTITLGLLMDTKTLENFQKRTDCVVNLPTPDMWQQVERLAPLTGLNPVPEKKQAQFRFEHNKFTAGAFTEIASERVKAPRAKECPVQLEATARKIHMLEGESRLNGLGGGAAVEVEVLCVHVHKDLVERDNYIAADRWQPLIYNFRHYFGLGEELGKTFRAEV